MKITDKQKAQLRDELVSWIQVCLGDENPNDSIHDYAMGLFYSTGKKEELLDDILYDFSDVESNDNTYKETLKKYKNPQCFFYGYRAGRKIFGDNLFFDNKK